MDCWIVREIWGCLSFVIWIMEMSVSLRWRGCFMVLDIRRIVKFLVIKSNLTKRGTSSCERVLGCLLRVCFWLVIFMIKSFGKLLWLWDLDVWLLFLLSVIWWRRIFSLSIIKRSSVRASNERSLFWKKSEWFRERMKIYLILMLWSIMVSMFLESFIMS